MGVVFLIFSNSSSFFGISLLIFFLCSGDIAAVQIQTKMSGNFAHTVFFWLKNPKSQSDRTKFEASITKFINNSKYVRTKYLGVPAGTNRSVVDNSYTYSLLVTFDNKEDQDKYQAEDVHNVFIAEVGDLWEKVVVYDSLNVW